MLDPTVSFVIFTALIPLVLLIVKVLAARKGIVFSKDAKQILAAAISVVAVGLQVWVIGALPVFAGDSLAIFKTAAAFFSGQMVLYEVIYQRVFALFE